MCSQQDSSPDSPPFPEAFPARRDRFSRLLHALRTKGFSLVEVTIAIGIVTFCLLALVGLLPVGLDSVRNARDESAAAQALELIAGSIRKAQAVTNSSGDILSYRALGAFSNLTWTNGGDSIDNELKLSLSGIPATDTREQRLKARVLLTSPGPTNTGSGIISIAWPVTATWVGGSNTWSNAQGSVSTWMVFLNPQ